MPILNLTISTAPDPKQSQALATRLTELTAEHLRKDPTITAVVVNHIEPQHWYVGGRPLANQSKSSFWLDITVVDGSNTKVELATWLDAIFAELSQILGNTHYVREESYALVHEVPASAYGYGGKTQEFRFVAASLQPNQSRL